MTLAEFDRMPDAERDLWVADWERERSTCTKCGRPLNECTDPTRPWFPYRAICWSTLEVRAAQARYAALHEERPFHDGTFTSWSKTRSAEHPYHFNDGVRIGVADRDLTPWDSFTTDPEASPIRPAEDD